MNGSIFPLTAIDRTGRTFLLLTHRFQPPLPLTKGRKQLALVEDREDF